MYKGVVDSLVTESHIFPLNGARHRNKRPVNVIHKCSRYCHGNTNIPDNVMDTHKFQITVMKPKYSSYCNGNKYSRI